MRSISCDHPTIRPSTTLDGLFVSEQATLFLCVCFFFVYGVRTMGRHWNIQWAAHCLCLGTNIGLEVRGGRRSPELGSIPLRPLRISVYSLKRTACNRFGEQLRAITSCKKTMQVCVPTIRQRCWGCFRVDSRQLNFNSPRK